MQFDPSEWSSFLSSAAYACFIAYRKRPYEKSSAKVIIDSPSVHLMAENWLWPGRQKMNRNGGVCSLTIKVFRNNRSHPVRRIYSPAGQNRHWF